MREKHIFTFGPDQHEVTNGYVLITGVDAGKARGIMVALYGKVGDRSTYVGEQDRERLMRDHEMHCVRVISIPREYPYTSRMADDVQEALR